MDKSFIPYHLRQNKAIDRNLFIELLYMVNRYFPIRKYEYLSMGGAFLEDFKIVHAHTGIERMISFEMDLNTFQRQKYNRPLKCVKLQNKTSADFIRDYDFPKQTIVWLDFTTPARLNSDLNDVFALMGKLDRGDVVNVTLNAHAASISISGNIPEVERPQRRFEHLENLIGDYMPADITSAMITNREYPSVLYKIIKLVVDRGISVSPDLFFQPLTSFVYADGQQMLTFTGVILRRDEAKTFLTETGIRKWDLSVVDRDAPLQIKIPELSIKERMLFDSLLPKSSAERIQRKLNYLIAVNDAESLESIENYIRYYKQYPYFSKVVL